MNLVLMTEESFGVGQAIKVENFYHAIKRGGIKSRGTRPEGDRLLEVHRQRAM